MVHEPDGLGLRRGHAAPREDHLLGQRRPDDAREQLRPADAGKDPARHLGHREDGRLRGDDEIGEHGQLAAAAHGEALDGGDHGHGAVEHLGRGRLEDGVLGAPCLVRHALALLQVAAHAEGLGAGAREDHAARGPVPLEGLEAAHEALAHGRVHGIERLGPVELDSEAETLIVL